VYYELVDIRKEIADYARIHRPFPPRSGSVSKPYPRFHASTVFWPAEDLAKLAEEKEMEEMSHFRVALIFEEHERPIFY
jgi:hypothetical protein